MVFRVVISVVLGFALGLTNLYIALKVGFTVGVTILTVFCWGGLDRILRWAWSRWRPLDRWDYACVQSLASAMSYGSATVMGTALGALLMISEDPLPLVPTMIWMLSICGLGTMISLPLRNAMLERFRFPSGTAAAETVEGMMGGGEMRGFFVPLIVSWIWIAWRELIAWIPTKVTLFQGGWQFQLSPMLLGLGGLLGFRTCASMLLGGVVFFVGIPAVWGPGQEVQTRVMWFAVSAMVCASLFEFSLDLVRSRGGVRWNLEGMSTGRYWTMVLMLSVLVGWASTRLFGVPVLLIFLALALLPAFCVVSCRVTGETDVVPTGALGKLALLAFGQLPVRLPFAHMVGTGVLAGASAASADFMNDLRCGERLGCPVRKQFWFQFGGAMVGPLLFVPILLLFLQTRFPVGGEVFPAPAAQIWLGVLRFTQEGWLGLELETRLWILAGAGVGVLASVPMQIKVLARWWIPVVPMLFAAFLDLSTVLTLFVGGLVSLWVKDGTKAYCAMLAAEGSAALFLLAAMPA